MNPKPQSLQEIVAIYKPKFKPEVFGELVTSFLNLTPQEAEEFFEKQLEKDKLFFNPDYTPRFLYSIENRPNEELPFCNRDDALKQMLQDSFNQWLLSLNPDFLSLMGSDGSIVSKIPFSLALTAMGMGKTRFMKDWALQVLQRDDILHDFVHRLGNASIHTKPTLSSLIEQSNKEGANAVKEDEEMIDIMSVETEGFVWTPPSFTYGDPHENLSRLFLFELRDAVECNRFIGFTLPAGFSTFTMNSDSCEELIHAYFLFAILQMSGGKLIRYKSQMFAMEISELVPHQVWKALKYTEHPLRSKIPNFLLELNIHQLLDLFVNNMQRPNSILEPFRKYYSPIVLFMVDDLHLFMDMPITPSPVLNSGNSNVPAPLKTGVHYLLGYFARHLRIISNTKSGTILPCFGGNAAFVDIRRHLDASLCTGRSLPLNILFGVQHFNFFMDAKFPRPPLLTPTSFAKYKEFRIAMWRNFSKWLGVPRIIDYLFKAARRLWGNNLEQLIEPEAELLSLDVTVAAQSEDYYKITDVKNINLPPWVICSIASGLPLSRDQPIESPEITKMADLETSGYIFPANDYAIEVIWATNLLTCKPEELSQRFPQVASFLKTLPCKELENIADPIDSLLINTTNVLSYVLFNPYKTRELLWKVPVKKGKDLENVTALSLWLRYKVIKEIRKTEAVLLSDIILNLPTMFKDAKVVLSGVMKLKKRFPKGRFWSKGNVPPSDYIYVNGDSANYADVFLWIYLNEKWVLLGIQCKNSSKYLNSHTEIEKEWNKSSPNVRHEVQKCDYLFFVNPQATKSNCPYGIIHSSFVPPELNKNCFLLDGRGLLPHFWWIATVEHAKKKAVDDSKFVLTVPDNKDTTVDNGTIYESDESEPDNSSQESEYSDSGSQEDD